MLAESVVRVGSFRQTDGQLAAAADAYRKALAMWARFPHPPTFDHYNAACAHARLAGIAALRRLGTLRGGGCFRRRSGHELASQGRRARIP